MCTFAAENKNRMMTEQNNRVSLTRIWQTLSHIRGVMPDMQLQQVAIAFVFLRRIDCLIGKYAQESASFFSKYGERLSDERLAEKLCEVSGGYPFYNYSGYTFKGILSANNSIGVVMNSYLQGFSDNVQEILEGMNFHQILATLQRQSRLLVDLFDQFAQIDLSEESVDNEEFVEMMSSLFDGGGYITGEYYTNYALSNLICECLLSVDLRTFEEDYVTIYDPVCGTGGMLATAGLKAKSFAIHQSDICLYGQEISLFPSAVAKAMVLLCGNEFSMVIYADTLTKDCFSGQHFQYILADNPFGLSWKPIQAKVQMEALDASGRFAMGLPSVSDSQFLFIENIISKMSPEGSRAAFLTNAAALYAGDARSGESRIRRWMFEHDLVETIIALPAGSHTVASIPIYLWILSNKKYPGQVGKVRLIDASSMKSKNRRNGLDSNMVNFIIDEYKSKIISMRSEIVSNDQFGFFEVDLLEDGKKKEKVSISLDTDIEEFIKKEIQPFAKGTITVDYSSVEKGYSVQFEKFFIAEETPAASLEDETQSLLSIIKNIVSLKANIEQIANKMKDKPDLNSWKELPLRSATDVLFGVNRPPVPNQDGLPILSVPYLRGASNEETLYDVSPKTKTASIKDVIIVVKGANTGEIFKGVDGILSPSLAAIKCTDENIIAPQYLYYLLKGNEKSLMSMAKGVTIKSLGTKSIPDFKCLIPPIKEQIRIASYLDKVVGEIDDVISALKGSGNAFVTYRQTLIENTIRGLWSVPEK